MIHDNNCAGGKIAAHDLINVQDTGKSIDDFISDKSGQTQQLWIDIANYRWYCKADTFFIYMQNPSEILTFP